MDFLRALRLQHDEWAASEIERLLATGEDPDEMHLATLNGVAFMCAKVLNDGVLVERASGWLVRLADLEHEGISTAVLDVFGRGHPPAFGAWVDSLLATLALHPFHLSHESVGLVQALQVYVHRAPEQVLRTANALVDELGRDSESAWGRRTSCGADLVDLALTLQDTPGFVEAGLDLFERLQDMNLYDAERVLNERDAIM